tara:strand:- start:4543 stop:6582 length:2040 start_codon:yes stop_codon:yes gene_type:complete
MSSFNTFTAAATAASNHTTGAKGANMLKSSGDLRLDAFLSLKRTSTQKEVSKTITELVRQIKYQTEDLRGEWIADIWRIWVHKRHPRSGEKEKLLGRHMFLELYNHFPNTCIELVKARIFGDMAYWKDVLLIWGMINEMDMVDKTKYTKYNPLITAFRQSFMEQRTEDLKALDDFITPDRIRDITKDKLIGLLKAEGITLPSISMIGKYCVREKSAGNKKLWWWIEAIDDITSKPILYKQSHVSFMLRYSLKQRVPSGGYITWRPTESVPFGAKQSWRKLNAKLDEVLDVPEVKETLGRIDEIDPTKLPGEYTKRKIKFLLNEMVKKSPTGEEDETGNRRPDDNSRVALRKRTREMFTDPSKMNVGTLLPHEIAYSAYTSKSIAQTDYHNAAFDKKVIDVRDDFDTLRKEMVDAGVSENDSGMVARAMVTGNILGVADVSGSMNTVSGGTAPNRPIDIATGLVAFISCIASKPYRDIAMSFTDIPSIFSFKVGDRPMTAKERITEIYRHVGYNTNYHLMHMELIDICMKNNVPVNQLPVLYIASDMNFDCMDRSIKQPYQWESMHASIAKEWLRAGYDTVPLMVYHNINVSRSGVQEDQNFKGVIQLTGRSEQVIKLVLYGEASDEVEQEVEVDGVITKMKVKDITPYDTFRKAMEGDHFALLESVLKESHEDDIKYYN